MKPIKVVKREDVERERDQVRSIEINMLRLLMNKYPEIVDRERKEKQRLKLVVQVA